MMKSLTFLLITVLGFGQAVLAQEEPSFPGYTEHGKEFVPPEPDFVNFIGMQFMDIPKGTYTMGGCFKPHDEDTDMREVTDSVAIMLMACPEGLQPDIQATTLERPSRLISLDYDFQVGMFEVTIAQYSEYLVKTSRLRTKDFFRTNSIYDQTPEHPVMHVSVHDAEEFARWLNKRKPEEDFGTYRLPSEAEWEYIARAETQTRYWWGNEINCLRADYGDSLCNAPGPSPVGSYKPNQFGLYDTHGNVSEWVSDCWSKYYLNAPEDGTAVTEEECVIFLHRGGSWLMQPEFLRNSDRKPSGAKFRHDIAGFRLVRDFR